MAYSGHKKTSNGAREYWAATKSPEELASHLHERRVDFVEKFHTSRHWLTARRNWRYYHDKYFASESYDNTAVKEIGDDGDKIGLAINHFGSLIDNLLTLSTEHDIDFKAIAINDDQRSIKQAEIGNEILEHYRTEHRLQRLIDKALKHALILAEGWIHCPWSWRHGPDVMPTVTNSGKIVMLKGGDFIFHIPSRFDIFRDYTLNDLSEMQWVGVKMWHNRWDVIEWDEARAYKDEILQTDGFGSEDEAGFYDEPTREALGTFALDSDYIDRIPVYYWYHEPCEAMPEGRQFRVVGEDIPLGDPEPLTYERIPVFPCIPDEILLTAFGYTPAQRLQPVQEMLNAQASTIATNHSAFGVQFVAAEQGTRVSEDILNQGARLLLYPKGSRAPQGVNLTSNPAESYKWLDQLAQSAEILSGVNAVARGNPQKSLESGEALKVMDAKAQQAAGNLTRARYRMFEEIGTFMVRTLRDKMGDDEQRVIAFTGEDQRTYLKQFTRDDLRAVDRIKVEAGNPLSKTVSGRLAIVEYLMKMGQMTTPEELEVVLRTGQVKSFTKAARAQIDLVHSENHHLQQGGLPKVSAIDNHVLHIREHQALINSVEARDDEQLSANVLAHIMSHLQMLMSLPVQMIQQTLGYQIPFPAQSTEMPQEESLQPEGPNLGGPAAGLTQNSQPVGNQDAEGTGTPLNLAGPGTIPGAA